MDPDTDNSVMEDEAAVLDAPEGTDTSGETPAGAEHAEGGAEGAADDLDDVVVTIGGAEHDDDDQDDEEMTPKARAKWAEMRFERSKAKREAQQAKAELERLRQIAHAQSTQAVVLGEKPTLEACDFDGEKFEAELTAWHDRKRTVEQQAQQAQEAQAKVDAEWRKRLNAFESGKAKLGSKVKDYGDAESLVLEHFNQFQTGVIIKAAAESATLFYALAKSPSTLKRLAAITDPTEFIWAASKVEDKVKVTERRAAPVPERVLRSSAPNGAYSDKKLEDLRAKCLETGNMDPYFAAKRAAQAKRA